MTGGEGPIVAEWAQKPWGVNYGIWTHPLTPYRWPKEGAEPYSVKPKSNRLGYRDWVSVTVGEKHKAGSAEPAPAVLLARTTRDELRQSGVDAKLRAGGWAMNNMEAIAYLSAEQPLHLAPDAAVQGLIDARAKRFARAADILAAALVGALRDALFSEGAKPSTDKSLFEAARGAFYERTEDEFHATLDRATDGASEEDEARAWLRVLGRAARDVFNETAPVPADEPERAGRIAGGFASLRGVLAGYGAPGKALFEELGLAAPDTKPRKKGDKA